MGFNKNGNRYMIGLFFIGMIVTIVGLYYAYKIGSKK